MSFLDTIKKLTKPYDEDDEFFDDGPDTASDAQPDAPIEPEPRRAAYPDYDKKPAPIPSVRRESKVVSLNNSSSSQMQIMLVKPERFEAAAEIADYLREKRSIVMNLEQTSKDVARRLIDFLSGVAYAQDGKIKKVANSTYLITPYNVDIMGDLIDELETGALYF